MQHCWWERMIAEVLHMRQSYQSYSQDHGNTMDAEYAARVQLGLGFFAFL